MEVKKVRCYFLYNIPVTDQILSLSPQEHIGVNAKHIVEMRNHFNVEQQTPPAFYTSHYKQDHTPYQISDPSVPSTTRIPEEMITEIDFFQNINICCDLKVEWELVLPLRTTGLITISVEVDGSFPSRQAYKLGGLHLNPDYAIIDTEPVQGLWEFNPDTRPKFVTLDQLAQQIHRYFFTKANLSVRRVQALRHEIQIPFISIEVETDCSTQKEFIEKNKRDLAEYVFKPGCWEVEEISDHHVDHVLNPERAWSVAEDTYVVVAYEGALYVKIKTFDTGVSANVSNFLLADEISVLHSFKLAVSNYHLLRIMDDLLDSDFEGRILKAGEFQRSLRNAFQQSSSQYHLELAEMNNFLIQFNNLRFQLFHLLEEMDNSDKLIDEEWHIVLLDRIHSALGTKIWRDSIQNRINNLRTLVEQVESSFQRLLNLNANSQILNLSRENQKVEDRLKYVSYIFGVLAMAELVSLMIDVGFNDTNPLILRLAKWTNTEVSRAVHIEGVILVLSLLVITFIGLIAWERYRPKLEDPETRITLPEEKS